MRFSSLITVLAWALPTWAAQKAPCLTDAEAQQLTDNFAWMIASWKLNITKSEELLLQSVSPTVHDYSASVVNLESAGCRSGPQPLDSTRDEFAADQLNVPPFELNVQQVWHSCDTISFRWNAPQRVRDVTGLVVLETVPAPPGRPLRHVIQTIYSEFDTAAFLVNTGAFRPANCTF
ncbi:hypothetical protein HFD88_004199 [Aspergillus terreus]|nr:hypothetical protein HFD88_004199 [Aspergillus terreus]